MIRKLLLLLTLCIWGSLPITAALFIPAAHAGPHPTLKKVAHVFFNHVTLDIAAGASDAFATVSISECRRTYGIGACYGGGYGDYHAREGNRLGFTTGMVLLGEFWRHSEVRDGTHGIKRLDWIMAPAIPLIVNLSIAIQNRQHQGCPISICKGT